MKDLDPLLAYLAVQKAKRFKQLRVPKLSLRRWVPGAIVAIVLLAGCTSIAPDVAPAASVNPPEMASATSHDPQPIATADPRATNERETIQLDAVATIGVDLSEANPNEVAFLCDAPSTVELTLVNSHQRADLTVGVPAPQNRPGTFEIKLAVGSSQDACTQTTRAAYIDVHVERRTGPFDEMVLADLSEPQSCGPMLVGPIEKDGGLDSVRIERPDGTVTHKPANRWVVSPLCRVLWTQVERASLRGLSSAFYNLGFTETASAYHLGESVFRVPIADVQAVFISPDESLLIVEAPSPDGTSHPSRLMVMDLLGGPSQSGELSANASVREARVIDQDDTQVVALTMSDGQQLTVPIGD